MASSWVRLPRGGAEVLPARDACAHTVFTTSPNSLKNKLDMVTKKGQDRPLVAQDPRGTLTPMAVATTMTFVEKQYPTVDMANFRLMLLSSY